MTTPVLLFDFGGVLVDLDKERCIRAFDDLGFDIRPFLGTFRQAGIFSLLERGEISVEAFCDELRRLAKNLELSDEQIIGAWEKYLLTVPAERLELLLKARTHYNIYVLSNTNVIHWAMAERNLFEYKGKHLSDFFDGVFLSCELGVEKPDAEIFQRVAEGIGCQPEEIIFFDDSEVNCEAARQSGLMARIAPANSAWLNYFDEDGRLKEI